MKKVQDEKLQAKFEEMLSKIPITGHREFREEFGAAVDLPVNAIAYEISDGGDLVRGKPHTWEALKSHVWMAIQSYSDLKHYRRKDVDAKIDVWLHVINNVMEDGKK